MDTNLISICGAHKCTFFAAGSSPCAEWLLDLLGNGIIIQYDSYLKLDRGVCYQVYHATSVGWYPGVQSFSWRFCMLDLDMPNSKSLSIPLNSLIKLK